MPPLGEELPVCSSLLFVLRFQHPDWVAMQTRQSGLEGTGEIKLRHLVKEALRMRPSRIVIGEVRAEECLDLLLALNSGLPGMATVHANSAREALVKLCTLPLLAGDSYPHGLSVNPHPALVGRLPTLARGGGMGPRAEPKIRSHLSAQQTPPGCNA